MSDDVRDRLLRVGDSVAVLRAAGTFDDVVGYGRIVRAVRAKDAPTLYWVTGFTMARTADVLRPVTRV